MGGKKGMQRPVKTGLTIRALFLFLLLGTTACNAGSSSAEKCDLLDLQRCASCTALANTINAKTPDQGEYYRGAYWNGLYAAYKLNCQDVGKTLLDNGANPNLGGTSGSFLASLVSAWPHNNEKINQQWAGLVSGYKIDSHWKNPYTDLSAQEVIRDEYITVDYPSIWKMLTGKQ